MPSQQDVEFKTIDGTTLRGRVYVAESEGPGIVMSPGFNAVKDMVGLPDVAMAFQQAGITALVYDPRSTGLSDGEPRNDIDPFAQIGDQSDALTFLRGHPMVDSTRVGVWGMSLGGAVALSCASFDKRAHFAIGVCPTVEYQYTESKIPSLLAKISKDRESQVKGNAPFCIPILTLATGENPAGFNLGIDKANAIRILSAQDEQVAIRSELAPKHVNRTTIQSYQKLLMWNPLHMWKHLGSTPVMFVVPEFDQLVPAEAQKRNFDSLPGPKRLHVEKGRGHIDILEGEGLPALMKLQIDFVNDALAGRVSQSS